MDSSSFVSLIDRMPTENSERRTLSSSTCLTRLLMFKQAILKPRFDGKKLDALERLELAIGISFSIDSGNVREIRELSACMELENQLDLKYK